MSFKKRVYAVLLVAAMAAGTFYVGKLGGTISGEQESFLNGVHKKDTITLWYTDDALTDYLSAAAVAYGENHEVRVDPVLCSSQELLEAVNAATLDSEQTAPDLYLITNDALEKAALAGLAEEVLYPEVLSDASQFGAAAKNAVTYKGKQVAYPFYFDTCVLLYNRSYLMDFARAQLEQEADQAAGEEAQEQAENGNVDEEVTESEQQSAVTDEEAWERVSSAYIPKTIEQLETFADAYDAPEQVEGVFRWDVSDIMYNYTFAGNYMTVGGECGDDPSKIDIYNLETVTCLTMFQKLNQFFSIETRNVAYDQVIQDFIDGKLVFTVASVDVLEKLEAAKQEGSFPYDYGFCTMPDLTDELMSRSRSITTAVVVNGYTLHRQEANDVALFITRDYADNLHERSGKLPAYRMAKCAHEGSEAFYQEYADSVPMTKMMQTGNFWMMLEIAFTDIWDGEDVSTTLKSVSENLMRQVTGEPYEEELITLPEEVVEEDEIIEEDGQPGSGAEN